MIKLSYPYHSQSNPVSSTEKYRIYATIVWHIQAKNKRSPQILAPQEPNITQKACTHLIHLLMLYTAHNKLEICWFHWCIACNLLSLKPNSIISLFFMHVAQKPSSSSQWKKIQVPKWKQYYRNWLNIEKLVASNQKFNMIENGISHTIKNLMEHKWIQYQWSAHCIEAAKYLIEKWNITLMQSSIQQIHNSHGASVKYYSDNVKIY